MDSELLKEKSIQELQVLMLENLVQMQVKLHQLYLENMEQQKGLLEQIAKNTNALPVAG